MTGMVSERQRQYKSTYARCNMVGTMLCILSPVPIFIGMAEGSDLAMILAVCGMLFLAGVGAADGRPLGGHAENFAVRRLRSGGEKAQPKGEGTFRCLLDARCGCVSRLELHDRGLEEHMDRLAGRGRAVRGGAASLPSVHEKPRRLSRRVFYGGERPEMD